MKNKLRPRRKIAFFTGNRAEFGILLPLIIELSRKFRVDILVSGTHVLPPWNTIKEVREMVKRLDIPVNIVSIKLNKAAGIYTRSLACVYEGAFNLFQKNKIPYEFVIVLGDRIETFGFALAAFYSKIPIIHIGGGDIENTPYFDGHVRHSLSKLASIHFTSNKYSARVLKQLGEEDWRISNIGNLSNDYDRLKLLSAEDEIEKELNLSKADFILLCSYHSCHFKTDRENLADFKKVLRAMDAVEGCRIILTYPNNDPGSASVIKHVSRMQEKNNPKYRVVVNLGGRRYLAILKHFKTIVVGNSSSGLSETPFYCVPALNIGNRQTARVRSDNVFDIPVDEKAIKNRIDYCIKHYDRLQAGFKRTRFSFGDGTASVKAKEKIDNVFNMDRNKILFKKFVPRKKELHGKKRFIDK